MLEATAIVASSTGLVAIVLVAVLAFKLAAALGVAADARVDGATKAGRLAIAAADVATWKSKADDERKRSDALDDDLAKSMESADPALARERVLARWQLSRAIAAHAADGHDARTVPAPSATTAAGPVDDVGASRV